MNPLVSIVVPVYNVEKYLKKCIESLINQTYSNIEIILVDDGSTDNSGKICDKYADKYFFIYALHKKNSGLGLTRNYGLDKSKGEYVTFVDSDDYVEEDLIANLVDPIIKDNSIDSVVGGFTKVDNEGNKLFVKKNTVKLFRNEQVKNLLFPRMLGSLPHTSDSIKPSVWNCLYSMQIIKSSQLRFVSERKIISEDIEWDSKYFARARKVKLIDSISYFYRANLQSLSQKYDPNRFEKYVYFYTYMIKRLNKLNLKKDAFLRLQKYFFISLVVSLRQLSQLSFFARYKKVREICNDKVVRTVVHNYPIKEMPLNQRLFVDIIKNKNILILTCICKLF